VVEETSPHTSALIITTHVIIVGVTHPLNLIIIVILGTLSCIRGSINPLLFPVGFDALYLCLPLMNRWIISPCKALLPLPIHFMLVDDTFSDGPLMAMSSFPNLLIDWSL